MHNYFKPFFLNGQHRFMVVVMESQSKFNFLTFDFEQALQWTLPIGQFATCQFWHFFWNGGATKLFIVNIQSLIKNVLNILEQGRHG